MLFEYTTRILNVVLAMTISVAWTTCSIGQISKTDVKDWPAGVVSRNSLGQDRSYDYDFSRISVTTLQTWLSRVGIRIPVKLEGELSGWVWAQRSAKGWLDFSNYKLEGEVNSPDLKIDHWLVRKARIRFGYADGNWYVGEVAGEVRAEDGALPIGLVNANAKILTASSSAIQVRAKIDSIDLNALLRSFGLEIDIHNSGGSVSIIGSIPIANASDLSKWKAILQVAVDEIALPWIESGSKASATLKLEHGKWEISNGQVKVAEQELGIAGTGLLNSELPFELSLAAEVINSSELLRQWKQSELSKQLTGSMRFDAKISGNSSKGISHAVATIESASLIVRSQPLEELVIVADYSPAGIQIEMASAKVAGGSVTGVAKWSGWNELSRGVPSGLDLEIQSLQLEKLNGIELPVQVSGQASGLFRFVVEDTGNGEDWSSSGLLEVNKLQVAEARLGDARLSWNKELVSDELIGNVNVHLGSGSAASNIRVKFGNRPDSTIRATSPRGYRAIGQFENYDFVIQIGGEPSETISIQAQGVFDVSGSPSQWLEQGEAEFSNSNARVGERLLSLEAAEVSFNQSEYRIERFRLLDPNGQISGAASLRRDKTGEHLLRLRVDDFPLKPYVERMFPKPLNSLDGVTTMELELRKNAAVDDLTSDMTCRLRGNLSTLNFQGKPMGELNFDGDLADGLVTANVEGQLLGGSANAGLKMPLAILQDNVGPGSIPAQLKIKIANVRAQRLAGLLFDRQFARKIAGSLSIELSADATSNSNLVVAGRIESPLVMHQKQTLARDLTAELKYSKNRLLIERLTGGIAGGRIEAEGYVDLNQDDISTFDAGTIDFVTQRLDANSLVAFGFPKYAKYFEGSIDYRGKAVFHRGVQLVGSATAKKGKLFGIPFQVARGNLRTEFTERGEFSRAVSRDLHGTAMGGTFDAKLDIRGGAAYSLKTTGTVSRGKLEQLGRAMGFENLGGTGTFDGVFTLGSRQIESIRALSGGLKIEFENGDVNSIPLLASIDRFVPLVQFASTNIENGRLDVRIGQGQMRVVDLIVNSKAFLLAASGIAAIDGSKLDLNLIVQTGGSVQQRLTQNAIERLFIGAAPQVAAVNQLNELIRNRTVFLHVGGSSSRPVFQTKPGQTAAKAFVESIGRGILATTTDPE